MKRLLIVCLTLGFLTGIPACCDDFMLVTGVDKVFFSTPASHTHIFGGEIVSDTLHMHVIFRFEEYTGILPGGLDLLTRAYCYSPCRLPTANRIVDLTVTSNRAFNDIPAGGSLNEKLYSPFYGAMDDVLTFLEATELREYFELVLTFSEKPAEPEHVFTFHLTDNAGNRFTESSDQIIWN